MMSAVINAVRLHAALSPERTALRTEDTRISYRELMGRVDSLTEVLERQGCRTVAFDIDNGIDWVTLDLAVMAAGLESIPIPGFFSNEQVRHVIKDADVDLFCFSGRSRHIQGHAISLGMPGDVTAVKLKVRGRAARAQKITYTSGSTGTPKGVCLDFETLDSVSCGIVETLGNIGLKAHLCVLPLPTLLENVAGLYSSLIEGLEVGVPSLEAIGLGANTLDIDRFVTVLKDFEPDSIIVVPQILNGLVSLAEFGLIDPGAIKFIAVGGGRVSQQLLERADRVGLPVYQGYGLSECASVVTLNVPGADRPGSVGKALPHADVRINGSHEIEVRGPVMRGYLGTRTRNRDWYPTGDLGHIDDDGYVFIDGRARDVFITSYGRNVNPEWVEAALTQQVAIQQSLVIGEGEPRNLALVWLRFEQTTEQIEDAIALANAELPEYARVHDYVVMSEPLPAHCLTANGRLRRLEALRECKPTIDDHYRHACYRNEDYSRHAVL